MPDLHLLANRTALARIRFPEHRIGAVPDGADGVADTRRQLDGQARALTVEVQVIEALDVRIKVRPPVPAPQTLQDLVRSGRRRLETERQGAARDWHRVRLALATQLREGLDR